MTELKIKDEFKNVLPPLRYDEYCYLEESIKKHGCLDSLKTWNNGIDTFILDGHARYKICTEHNIPFKTMELEFENKYEAIEWIIQNQLGRSNLNDFQKIRIDLQIKRLKEGLDPEIKNEPISFIPDKAVRKRKSKKGQVTF